MKKYYLLILVIYSTSVFSQNVGIGTNTPDPSAKLDISSTNSGFLIPRLTTIQRDSISNPAEGLQIYNISSGCIELYAFGKWGSISCFDISNTTVKDYDNNSYPMLRLCQQIWMQKNLNVSHYKNGDIIPKVTDSTLWANLTSGAWSWYNNDSATYAATYGKLYNWYAVNDSRGLAPAGWHIPSNSEWSTLATCLGGAAVAGGCLKEPDYLHWIDPNAGVVANNWGNTIVISQIYGAGGNSGSLYNADYIELHNISSSTINLLGYSLQYASATNGAGNLWNGKTKLPAANIEPGGYYLVQMSNAINVAGAAALPTPDYTASPAVALGATNGRVALINDTSTIIGCPTGNFDLVGYGTSICFEGTAAAGALDSTHAAIRNNCDDINNNYYDFSILTPSPRNSSSPKDLCPEITISGFNALPAGDRNNQVLYGFWHKGYFGTWWSSSENNLANANAVFISNTSKAINGGISPKKNGFSIRCIKN